MSAIMDVLASIALSFDLDCDLGHTPREGEEETVE